MEFVYLVQSAGRLSPVDFELWFTLDCYRDNDAQRSKTTQSGTEYIRILIPGATEHFSLGGQQLELDYLKIDIKTMRNTSMIKTILQWHHVKFSVE